MHILEKTNKLIKIAYVLQKGLRIKVYNLILYILFMKTCENQ